MNGNEQVIRHGQTRAARGAATRRSEQSGKRDGTQFLALPVEVARSEGWLRASHAARALVIAMATAPTKNGGVPFNGRLMATMNVLRGLGWRSEGTVRNKVKELIECGLLHQTRQSSFPNVAALYAVTWLSLGPRDGLAADMVRTFERGAYNAPDKPAKKPQRSRTRAATEARKANMLARDNGYMTAPSHGDLDLIQTAVGRSSSHYKSPSDGAMWTAPPHPKPPSHGANLDIAISRSSALTLMGRRFLKSRSPILPDGYIHARRASQWTER